MCMRSRRNGFPHLNTAKRDLVHPGDAYTDVSVIPSVLCSSEGEMCSLEDKDSGRNLFEDCSEGGKLRMIERH